MWPQVILAVLKAIPGLMGLFQRVMDMHFQRQDRKLEADDFKAQQERDVLVEQFKKPDATPEERNAMRRKLYELQKR